MTKNLPALDGLRALAVVEVIFFHCRAKPFTSGWVGVELFFALSGFLVSRILMGEFARNGSVDVRGFIKRRFLRLYPALGFFLIFFGYYAWKARLSTGVIFSEISSSVFGYANWSRAYRWGYPRHLAHLWSLSVEIQFYLMCAVLAFAANQFRKTFPNKRFSTTAATVLLLVAMVVFHEYRDQLIASGARTFRIYNGFDSRVDSFLIGTLAAVLLAPGTWLTKRIAATPRMAWVTTLIGFLGVGLHLYASTMYGTPQPGTIQSILALTSFSALLILVGACDTRPTAFVRFFAMPPLRFLGLVSFGLYLWHYPVNRLVVKYRLSPLLHVLVVFGISLVGATASYFLVERRFMRRGVIARATRVAEASELQGVQSPANSADPSPEKLVLSANQAEAHKR